MKNGAKGLIGLIIVLIMIVACAAPQVKKETEELYWPLPPDKPRIKFVAAYQSERDLNPSSNWIEALVGPDPTKGLIRPFFALSDRAGSIYVSDTQQRMVFKFDLNKKKVSTFGPYGIPLGMDIIHSKGILLVADSLTKVVIGIRLDNGRQVMGISSNFIRPVAIRVDEKRQRIYVSDTGRNDIQVFDLDGRYIFTIGKRGMGDGEFLMPMGIDIDSEGRIYVADSFNYRIQVLDMNGNYIRSIGYGVGKRIGNFDKLKSVALDSEDHVYALDASFSNIQIFDKDNNVYLFWGSPGNEIGKFFLPSSIYIDDDDYIYVADSINSRVQVFQYLKEK